MTAAAMPPLWRQLNAAAAVLMAVRCGRTSAAGLETVDKNLRAAAQALSFDAMRQLGRAEALRSLLAARPPPPAADALLCCALALLWRSGELQYDEFTLVDQTIEAAKHNRATRSQAPFINACLRRFLRERGALVRRTDVDPVARWNHPLWWIERLRSEYPEQWKSILAADNRHPPLTLRVNQRQRSVDAYLAQLAGLGVAARKVGRFAVQLERPQPVQRIAGFAEGLVSVQDAAAQLAAPLLLEAVAQWQSPGDQGQARARPQRILDACAAPGGKTAHLLELADSDLTAIELDPIRCQRIGENLHRLGLHAKVVAADAARPQDWFAALCGGEPFDAILLDAPCTASGIVRRRPDVRWLRRETDIDQLARTQAGLLAALWPLLRDGGYLLYCTCSVFHAEGQAQIKAFLAHNRDAQLQPSPGQLLPGEGAAGAPVRDNGTGGHDGFFYALLQKREM